MEMPNKKKRALPAQGYSDPQGTAGVGGIVPASSSSTSDDGPSRESRVGSREERTTAPKSKWETLSGELTDHSDRAGRWISYCEQLLEEGDRTAATIKRAGIKRIRAYLIKTMEILSEVEEEMSQREDKDTDVGESPKTRTTRNARIGPDQPGTRNAKVQVSPPRGVNKRVQAESATTICGTQTGPEITGLVETGVQVLPRRGKRKATQTEGGNPFLEKEPLHNKGSPTPPDMGGRASYVEVVKSPPGGGTPNPGRSPGMGPAPGVAKEPGTRRRQVFLRVPGMGDVGLLGLEGGDLLITVPSLGDETPARERREPIVKACTLPSRPRAREGRGNGGRPEGGGVSPRADPPPLRCYRCLELGHSAKYCQGPDRSRRCYRCSADSCKWRSCRSGVPKCPLCVDLGAPDRHILGSGGCGKLPPERRKRGRHKDGRTEGGKAPEGALPGGKGAPKSP